MQLCVTVYDLNAGRPFILEAQSKDRKCTATEFLKEYVRNNFNTELKDQQIFTTFLSKINSIIKPEWKRSKLKQLLCYK